MSLAKSHGRAAIFGFGVNLKLRWDATYWLNWRPMGAERLDGYCQKHAERRDKILNGSIDGEKGDNRLSYKSGRPDLLSGNISQARFEDMAPDIRKGAKTKQHKSAKPEPAGHVVEGDPADMMIPGDDETFGLSLATGFRSQSPDICTTSRHVFGIEFITLSQPARLFHEVGFINFLNAVSKIIRRISSSHCLAAPFARERRESALDSKR